MTTLYMIFKYKRKAKKMLGGGRSTPTFPFFICGLHSGTRAHLLYLRLFVAETKQTTYGTVFGLFSDRFTIKFQFRKMVQQATRQNGCVLVVFHFALIFAQQSCSL